MSEDVPIGRLVSIIVSVLAAALLLARGGRVVVGVTGPDNAVSLTLTHVIETILGVFVGIAAGSLASRE